MSKIIRDTSSGRYFVQGQGFTGTVATATQFGSYSDAQDAVECAGSMGVRASIENAPAATVSRNIQQNADGSSFACNFLRKKDRQRGGGYAANSRNPSPRRFKTQEEAEAHGRRFTSIEKHDGYTVTQVYESVNAWVNQLTGKTNPLIGRKRTCR